MISRPVISGMLYQNCFAEPDHSRAVSNKYFYEKIIEDEDKNSKKRGDDSPAPFSNKRPLDEYRTSKEFSDYEALCRGEELMVSSGFIDIFFLLGFLLPLTLTQDKCKW